MKILLCAILLIASTCFSTSAEGDLGFVEIDVNRVPELVTKAVRETFPDYVIDQVILEKDGSDIYSLALNHKSQKKQSASIVVDSKGVVHGKTVDVKASDVPPDVLKAVRTKHKDIDIHYITHDKDLVNDKWTEEYFVYGLVAGQYRSIRVDKSGRIISDLTQEEQSEFNEHIEKE